MAPRYRPHLTPAELRARRIRAAFLGSFALFSLLALLGVAWFGVVAQRRSPAWVLRPAVPPDGQLRFAVAPLLEDIGVTDRSAMGPEEQAFLTRVFAPAGEVLYWRGTTPDGAADWVAFLPLARPHRLWRRHLEQVLAAVPAISRQGKETTTQALAVWEIRPEGLLLTPGGSVPALAIERDAAAPAPPTAAEAWVYRSAGGFVPPLWRRRLPPDALPAEGAPLALRWADRDGSPTLLLAVASPAGETEYSLPWFHPFGLGKESSPP